MKHLCEKQHGCFQEVSPVGWPRANTCTLLITPDLEYLVLVPVGSLNPLRSQLRFATLIHQLLASPFRIYSLMSRDNTANSRCCSSVPVNESEVNVFNYFQESLKANSFVCFWINIACAMYSEFCEIER